MIYVISPAKTMNKQGRDGNLPCFNQEKALIMEAIRNSSDDVLQINKLSSKKQEEVRKLMLEEHEEKRAIDLYDGMCYRYLNYHEMDDQSQQFALKHLRIVSPLYGLLELNDAIMPYRLDIKSPLLVEDKRLVLFWRERLVEYLKRELMKEVNQVMIDLTSKEFQGIWDKDIDNRVIIDFVSKGKKEPIKKLRGSFANIAMINQIDDLEGLKSIVVCDYVYDDDLSDDHHFVYVREKYEGIN